MNLIVIILLAAFAAVYITGPIVDPDLWWHITAGRWIIANKTVPHQDYWNMFGVGDPWRAYSWSNEILFAWVDSAWGVHGLLVLKWFFALSIAGSFFYCFIRLSKDLFFGSVLGLFTTIATFSHFTLRPQSLTWMFFVWVLYHAELIVRNGLSAKRGLTLTLIFSLWANTHITTILGFGAIALWLFDNNEPKKNLPLIGRVLLYAFLGMLLTPYFGGELLTVFSKASHPFVHSDIVEFHPAQINQYPTGLMVLLFTLLLLFLHAKPKCLSPAKIFLAGGFVLAALGVIKFIPQAVIVLSALLALIWWEHRDDPKELGNLALGFVELGKVFTKIPKAGGAFVVLCLIIVNVWRVWRVPLEKDVVPEDALNFMIEHNTPLPVLNLFGDGGYVMYRYSDSRGTPKTLVSIDGRTNITPPDIAEAHGNTARGLMNWREYLDKVKPETVMWRNELPLNAIFFEGNEWCLVFRAGDQKGGNSVYIRREYFEAHRDKFESQNCK